MLAKLWDARSRPLYPLPNVEFNATDDLVVTDGALWDPRRGVSLFFCVERRTGSAFSSKTDGPVSCSFATTRKPPEEVVGEVGAVAEPDPCAVLLWRFLPKLCQNSILSRRVRSTSRARRLSALLYILGSRPRTLALFSRLSPHQLFLSRHACSEHLARACHPPRGFARGCRKAPCYNPISLDTHRRLQLKTPFVLPVVPDPGVPVRQARRRRWVRAVPPQRQRGHRGRGRVGPPHPPPAANAPGPGRDCHEARPGGRRVVHVQVCVQDSARLFVSLLKSGLFNSYITRELLIAECVYFGKLTPPLLAPTRTFPAIVLSREVPTLALSPYPEFEPYLKTCHNPRGRADVACAPSPTQTCPGGGLLRRALQEGGAGHVLRRA